MNIDRILWNCVFQENIKIIFFHLCMSMREFQLHTFSVDLIFAAKKKNQDYEILACQVMEFQPVKSMKQSPEKIQFAFKKFFLSGMILFDITDYNIAFQHVLQ